MGKGQKRFISLAEGTGMDDLLLIFETDAPVEELKKLEEVSNEVYLNGGSSEDIPIWAEVLAAKGYVFEFMDDCWPYETSKGWLKKYYPQITESYCIENHPFLNSGKVVKKNYIIVIDYILKTECTSNSIDLYRFCGTDENIKDAVQKLAFRFFYIDKASNGVFDNIPYLELLESNVNGTVYSILVSHENFKAVIYAIEECNIPNLPNFEEESFKDFVEKLSSKKEM